MELRSVDGGSIVPSAIEGAGKEPSANEHLKKNSLY